jgi:gliding motility-associated lipoprotein GldD
MRYSLPTCLMLLCLVLGLVGCGTEPPPVPKPRSYPRVMYPERAYQPLSSDYCDFTFSAPKSAKMVREDFFFDEAPPDSCWFDLKLDPALNGKIHFSYYPVTSFAQWEELRDQAFELVGVHNSRASDIEEIVIHRDDNDVHGIAFDIAGPAASPFQFFLTDSTNHFLRAALYFDTTIQPDSLAPVIEYVKEDIFTIVESFQWEAK